MPTSPLFLAAALCAVVYLPLSPRPASLIRSVVKTASVFLLAVLAAMSGAPAALIAALVLCALGDWLLSRETETTFMAGVGAFAAGHIAYVVLFLALPLSDPNRLLDMPHLLGVVALLMFGVAMVRILAPHAGDLKGPVLAYIPIILSMGLAALTLPSQGHAALILPAALAFMASDTVLAVEKFLLPDGHPALRWTPFVVWPLYWGAQAAFVAAVV